MKKKINSKFKLDLKDYKHPYYFTEGNYYSDEPNTKWETWEQFYDSMGHADVDLNLVVRWDIEPIDDRKGDFSLKILIIQQRKGIYAPHEIRLLQEKDLEELTEFLKKHWATVQDIWKPFSNTF